MKILLLSLVSITWMGYGMDDSIITRRRVMTAVGDGPDVFHQMLSSDTPLENYADLARTELELRINYCLSRSKPTGDVIAMREALEQSIKVRGMGAKLLDVSLRRAIDGSTPDKDLGRIISSLKKSSNVRTVKEQLEQAIAHAQAFKKIFASGLLRDFLRAECDVRARMRGKKEMHPVEPV